MPTIDEYRKVQADIKKAEPALIKVYISPKKSAAKTGESFWAEQTAPGVAIVRNICMCGLGVGDIIKFRRGSEARNEHPNMYVEVQSKVCDVYPFSYTFDGMMNGATKFPAPANEFLSKLAKEHNIRFEGVVMGVAAIQCPSEMTCARLQELLNSGPMKFELMGDDEPPENEGG